LQGIQVLYELRNRARDYNHRFAHVPPSGSLESVICEPSAPWQGLWFKQARQLAEISRWPIRSMPFINSKSGVRTKEWWRRRKGLIQAHPAWGQLQVDCKAFLFTQTPGKYTDNW